MYKPKTRTTNTRRIEPTIHERQMMAATAPITARIRINMNNHGSGFATFMRHLPHGHDSFQVLHAARATGAKPGRSALKTARQSTAWPARRRDIARWHHRLGG